MAKKEKQKAALAQQCLKAVRVEGMEVPVGEGPKKRLSKATRKKGRGEGANQQKMVEEEENVGT